MADRSLGSMLLLLLATAAAVIAGIYAYNRYIEPQHDGPMERAGEKLDNALDGK